MSKIRKTEYKLFNTKKKSQKQKASPTKQDTPPTTPKLIKESIKELEEQKKEVLDQIKDPNIMKMGMGLFMPAIKSLALGGILMGVTAAFDNMSKPMKPLDIPIPTLPSNMMPSGVPAPIIYSPHENNSRSLHIDKLINNMDKLGNVVLLSGFEGLSESSRKTQATKNLHSISKKFDIEIKQLQKELNTLTATNGLNTIIAGKQGFTYPTIENVNTFDDFADKINVDLEKPDSAVAELYKEFSDVHKDLDEEDKKEIFTNSLFDKVLDVTFKNSFDNLKEDDELEKNNEIIYSLKDKLLSDKQYKDILFNDTESRTALSKIDNDVRKDNRGEKTFDILLKEIDSKDNKDKSTASDNMRDYMAYKHRQNLEKKNPVLLKLIKEREKRKEERE